MSPRIPGAAALLAAALGTGCQPPPDVAARQPGAFREAPVLESSGAAMSRAYPGRFWTLNDSGNPASLFLADTLGRIEGFVTLEVRNTDWEAVATGPCGPLHCLYVGDLGDNGAVRSSVTIYRVAEPALADLRKHSATVVDSLVLRYHDGPRDAETLIVDSLGNAAIITKGQSGAAAGYRIPATAWGGPPIELRADWAVPISTSLLLARLITDGALSPDGRILALRTYRGIHLFKHGPGDDWLPTAPAGECDIHGLEPQGEGLTWLDDRTLLLTSETLRGRAGPITLLQCPTL